MCLTTALVIAAVSAASAAKVRHSRKGKSAELEAVEAAGEPVEGKLEETCKVEEANKKKD